jgi:hypothetical protein
MEAYEHMDEASSDYHKLMEFRHDSNVSKWTFN